jgi:murein L,D-transpeptidase YafK
VIKRFAIPGLVFGALLSCAVSSWAATPEDRLSSVFEAIEANKLDLALKRVDALIAEHPNFRLAHLVRGDLLLARTRPLQTFGDVVKTVPQDRVDDLREEALMRLRARSQRPAENRVPGYVLQMQPDQKHVLLVDSRRSRLYVYANDGGKPKLIADYYVTLGKNGIEKQRQGDQKTPVGVYHVTANLPRNKLSDFYGSGAFPINYPNEWDRRQSRTGHGIWLHGVPSDVYSRPPRASDGCIVLANPDLESLGRHVQVGLTPVIIANEVEWTEPGAVEADRAQLALAIEQWRTDWQSKDTEKYLTHYSQRFASGTQDFAAWAKHKRLVNAAKAWIEVKVSRVGMLRFPQERDIVVVTFDQNYRSDGLKNVMKKRQYWLKEAGRWKIIYEGAA